MIQCEKRNLRVKENQIITVSGILAKRLSNTGDAMFD